MFTPFESMIVLDYSWYNLWMLFAIARYVLPDISARLISNNYFYHTKVNHSVSDRMLI